LLYCFVPVCLVFCFLLPPLANFVFGLVFHTVKGGVVTTPVAFVGGSRLWHRLAVKS
jgi:hypothetical protein